MKIFDYTGKNKGEIVADLKYSGTSYILGKIGKLPVHESFSTVKYLSKKEVEFTDHYADDFKRADGTPCEMVIMCSGCIVDRETGKEEWEWFAVPKKEWSKQATERNKRVYGTHYYKGD